jgi:hypothetical protein
VSNLIAWSSEGNYDGDDFFEITEKLEEDEVGRECPDCKGWGCEDQWDEDSAPCIKCGGEGYL